MNTPYIYWLKNVVANAETMDIQVGPDPGYYTKESAGTFATSLAKAQTALESNDNAIAQSIIPELEKAIVTTTNAEVNPMIPGIYVIESAYVDFFKKQGKTKAIVAYYNDFEAGSPHCTSEYSLWWTDGPANLADAHKRYQFEFISAKNNEQVQIWLEDGLITAEEAENAYFLKNLEINQYVSAEPTDNAEDLGFTTDSIHPYIVRSRGTYKFEIFYPCSERVYKAYGAFHTQGHSSATGIGGDVIYWTGTAAMSQWHLRSIDARTSINDIVVDNTENTEVLSISYYTTNGTSIPEPVKGINIVKKVYADGVIKTEKIFIK